MIKPLANYITGLLFLYSANQTDSILYSYANTCKICAAAELGKYLQACVPGRRVIAKTESISYNHYAMYTLKLHRPELYAAQRPDSRCLEITINFLATRFIAMESDFMYSEHKLGPMHTFVFEQLCATVRLNYNYHLNGWACNVYMKVVYYGSNIIFAIVLSVTSF